MIKALGIVGFASDTTNCGQMESRRSVGAFMFLGRYRIIDFPISNMSNSGIPTIQVYIRKKPRSIINHIGERSFNLNSKQGGLSVYFGADGNTSPLLNTDISAYYENIREIEKSKYPYVIITAGNVVSRLNFEELLDEHIRSGCDVTIAYKFSDDAKTEFMNCDTVSLSKEKQITFIGRNQGIYKTRNISLETYVLSKDLFVELIREARQISSMYWFRDVLNEKLNTLDVKGYAYRGPAYIIKSFNDYYNANMKLLNRENAKDLFKQEWTIYTRTSDSVPAQYEKNADVSNSLIANGAVVKGTVKNSVLGRGVIVEEGALIENSIVLSESYIGKDVHLQYTVVDKDVHISKVKDIKGTTDNIVYIEKGSKV